MYEVVMYYMMIVLTLSCALISAPASNSNVTRPNEPLETDSINAVWSSFTIIIIINVTSNSMKDVELV